jgi:hypothetical protein
MHYIQLNDDSFILKTKKGPITLTRKNFNFNKIKNMLKQQKSEEEILPFLDPPELPEGLYYFYLIPNINQVFYEHIQDTREGINTVYKDMSGNYVQYDTDKELVKLLGVYASFNDIIADWPEYTI